MPADVLLKAVDCPLAKACEETLRQADYWVDRHFAHLVEREAVALRQSEEQFRALYRRTPLPLHALDANGRIQEVGDAWLDLMGYSREEVYDHAFIEFMTARSAHRRTQDCKLLFDEGLLVGREYNLITKDGRILDMLSTSRVERGSDGGFPRVIGGLTDVTERRRTEEALRQSQKMESVGLLAGGIAHDLLIDPGADRDEKPKR